MPQQPPAPGQELRDLARPGPAAPPDLLKGWRERREGKGKGAKEGGRDEAGESLSLGWLRGGREGRQLLRRGGEEEAERGCC